MNKNFEPITNLEKKMVERANARRQSLAERFPLVFGMAATFGFVSVLYGFEKLIDRVALFENNPWILLGVGVVVLLVTGRLYKKLD